MEKYEIVYVANGQLEANMVKIMLEAHGFSPIIRGESAGVVYGLTVGTLGEVKIFVPGSQLDQALELIQKMEKGELEDSSDDSETTPDNEP